ncbi:hypothetical protein Tco_0797582 [Tanacetum coccineum]
MDTTRAEQIALDDALVAPAKRLKIGKINLRLSSDLKSKEATLQVVYDVLKLTPFYKAFQITQFEELPFEEEILTFLRDIGHSGEIKDMTVFDYPKLKSFGGMYHKKNVDYAYLLWEDFVYQVENKNVKRSSEMYYPRFTKVIINFFMAKDQSIPRRNKVYWHFARDGPMFTMIKVVSRLVNTQLYGAFLPIDLTNEAIKDLESYKEYYAIASGAEHPKTKASVKKKQFKSDKAKTPPATKGKILKTTSKVTKPSMKKQPTQGLGTLSEVALTEEEQMRIVTKRSLTEYHSSHASGSGADEKSSSDEDDDVESENDDDNDDDDNQDDDGQEYDEHDDEEQGDDDEKIASDNDGDDFVHPKFSSHDEEDSFDPQVTPSHVESTDDEDSDEKIQDENVKGDKMNEEETNEEAEVDALYRDVNVNLDGIDTKMTDAPRTIVQTTQVIEDTHVIITLVNPEGQQQSSSVSSGFISNMLNPSPDTGIDSLFNLNIESTSLVDVSVTTIVEPPMLSATTLPPPPTPLITHLQLTPVPTPPTVLSSSLQDRPNFSSLFGFDHILKTLENNFLEFNQTNQFAAAVSSIPDIIYAYLANKMHEAVKTIVQLQSNRLRDEAQAKNAYFINKLNDNIKKIIKDQVKEQVKAQVSKILPKIKKTVNEQLEAEVRSDEQKNLYKALVDAYECDKLILDTYGETVSFKRRRDEEDKDEEPSAGLNRGSKKRRAGKEPESTSAPKEKTSKTTGKSTEGSKSHQKSADESAQAEEPMQTAKDLEEPTHQDPDRDWNKTFPDAHGPVQPWLSSLAKMEDLRELFNELMDTPLHFSVFVMNRLKVDTLTPEILAGPTFELTKGSCKSLVELEYFFKEVYKATTDQLDWNNLEGHQYPHDLRKPLPLIPNSRGRRVIPFDHFINNDLVYLSGGVSSRTYTTLVMKTKAADYGHIKWIEDLVPNIMESARDVYSKRKIIAVIKLQIVEWHTYKHMDWITVRRDDEKLYTFKEGDFNRLRIQDIEDMLLLLVQGKLTNLTIEERLGFNVSLRMFTRRVVIQRRVEDLQLGVESYQKKLNLTKPDTYRSDLKRKEAYSAYSNPRGNSDEVSASDYLEIK